MIAGLHNRFEDLAPLRERELSEIFVFAEEDVECVVDHVRLG
jgi:hypothetical protein